jgi:ubiquinone/menaquinone biosynthesis C-methylase UbiE
MATDEKTIGARKAALGLHESGAEWLVRQYANQKNFYSSSFFYGRQQINRHFREVIATLPHGSMILDVGCGTSDQLARIYSLGISVVEIEPKLLCHPLR